MHADVRVFAGAAGRGGIDGLLVRVQPALEQRAQDGRVDVRPVQFGGFAHGVDAGPVQRQRDRVVVEEPAVEPRHFVVADHAAGGHLGEEVAGQPLELLRSAVRLLQHAPEEPLRQQVHVFGEHAEDQPVDEPRHGVRVVAALAQPLGQVGERGRGLRGERLAGLLGPQPFRVAEGPLEQVEGGGVFQVVEREFVDLADAVGPVGVDAEAPHVGDDEQGRVLQRQRVLPQLLKGGVQVGVGALVFPGEVPALPHVRPAALAAVLPRLAFKSVALAGGVILRRRLLAQHPAEVDEVLLRRRPLVQRHAAPLGDELGRRHPVSQVASSTAAAGRNNAPILPRSVRRPPGTGLRGCGAFDLRAGKTPTLTLPQNETFV